LLLLVIAHTSNDWLLTSISILVVKRICCLGLIALVGDTAQIWRGHLLYLHEIVACIHIIYWLSLVLLVVLVWGLHLEILVWRLHLEILVRGLYLEVLIWSLLPEVRIWSLLSEVLVWSLLPEVLVWSLHLEVLVCSLVRIVKWLLVIERTWSHLVQMHIAL